MMQHEFKSAWGVPYDHGALEGRRRVLHWTIRNFGFRVLLKYRGVEGLEHFPASGPAILMINHIAFVDPAVVVGSVPRMVVPMAKVEAFKVPIWGLFPGIWRAIPVSRGDIDRKALRMALEVLAAGEIILVAPEGTRSPSLQQGKEGVAYLAAKSGAPIVPVAIEGTEGFPSIYPLGWRRTGATVRIGPSFRFKTVEGKVDRNRLHQMTEEAMYILAGLLPAVRRGVYSDLSQATTETLDFV
ncbi:MAG: 1-acyl-sn-glycerol-3-phosphate acyltransferase [Anaerolineales bacterium]|nr:MAG: 1-acyl-sn-glycerol-3-phosphate acyltransferase [Anaerolineales bacterium]